MSDEYEKIFNPPADLNVAGLNRNALPYPTEVGSAYFPPVKVEDIKSYNLSLSVNRYNEKVAFLQKQADIIREEYEKIRARMELAFLIDQAKYAFKPVSGNVYYLQKDWAGRLVLNLCNITYNEFIHKVQYRADGEWIILE